MAQLVIGANSKQQRSASKHSLHRLVSQVDLFVQLQHQSSCAGVDCTRLVPPLIQKESQFPSFRFKFRRGQHAMVCCLELDSGRCRLASSRFYHSNDNFKIQNSKKFARSPGLVTVWSLGLGPFGSIPSICAVQRAAYVA